MIASKLKDILPSNLPVTVGDLPSPNVEAIGLIEFDGYYNTMYLGMGPSAMVGQPLVKAVARTASYATGEQWMETIKNTLSGYINEQLGILSITMVGVPTYLGRNTQKFHEFQIVFQIHVKE